MDLFSTYTQDEQVFLQSAYDVIPVWKNGTSYAAIHPDKEVTYSPTIPRLKPL